MEGGDEMIDMRFLYQTDLPSRAIYVYLYLVLRANREGQCWPAVPRIAADLKLSERTAKSSQMFYIKKKQ